MISKIILFTTAILTVNAQQYPPRYYTSQSLIPQDFHTSQTPRGKSYTEPIVHRPALIPRPFPLHLAPVYENVVEDKAHVYFAPDTATVQKVLPSVHNVAPYIRYAYDKTPFMRYAAPYVASVVNHVTPIQRHNYNYPVIHQERNTPPEYKFKYSLEDHYAEDVKYQQEKYGGGYVTGDYGTHDPVSSVRTVLYDDNNHSGFSAIVKHSQPSTHVQPNH